MPEINLMEEAQTFLFIAATLSELTEAEFILNGLPIENKPSVTKEEINQLWNLHKEIEIFKSKLMMMNKQIKNIEMYNHELLSENIYKEIADKQKIDEKLHQLHFLTEIIDPNGIYKFQHHQTVKMKEICESLLESLNQMIQSLKKFDAKKISMDWVPIFETVILGNLKKLKNPKKQTALLMNNNNLKGQENSFFYNKTTSNNNSNQQIEPKKRSHQKLSEDEYKRLTEIVKRDIRIKQVATITYDEKLDEVENVTKGLAIPGDIICSLRQDIMRKPVTLITGHSYHQTDLLKHFVKNNTNPLTNEILESKITVENSLLHEIIQYLFSAFRDENEKMRLNETTTTTFTDQKVNDIIESVILHRNKGELFENPVILFKSIGNKKAGNTYEESSIKELMQKEGIANDPKDPYYVKNYAITGLQEHIKNKPAPQLKT